MLAFFLTCARKEPHYRIYFSPSFFLGLEGFFDPTVMPLSSLWLFEALRPSPIISAFLRSSSLKTIILGWFFLSPVDTPMAPLAVACKTSLLAFRNPNACEIAVRNVAVRRVTLFP